MIQLLPAAPRRLSASLAVFLFFIGLLTSSFSALANTNPLVVVPQKPKVGEKVKVRYNPAGTPLTGVRDFEAYAYLFDECRCQYAQPRVQKIAMTAKGEGFEGNIATADSTKVVVVKFKKGEVVDNNKGEGYVIPLYGPNGKLAPGVNAYLSQAVSGTFGFATGIKGSKAASAKYAADEFTLYPGSKKTYIHDYLGLLLKSGTEEDKEEALKTLAAMAKEPAADEARLQTVYSYYQRMKEGAKSEEIKNLIQQKFPKGEWLRNEKISAFNKEKDLQKKEALYTEVVQAYPPATDDQHYRIDNMHASLAQAFAQEGAYDKMETYLAKIHTQSILANTLNSIAWKLSGGGVSETPKDVEVGKKLSQQSLQVVQAIMNTGAGKPKYFTEEEWMENNKGQLHSYSDTYALLLYHSGDYQKAYDVQKEVVRATERKRANLNEMYAAYVEKVKGPAEAQNELEAFLSEAAYTAKMKDQLKRLYTTNHTEEQWQGYLAGIEQKAKEAKKKELMGKLVNKPAPQFALKDMSGADIALKDLKGKVVVVDFWATWCGPCISSFPGMQKMVDKYKDSKEVAFVFIDTWENIENREQVVKDFIDKKGYTFQVLFDQVKPQSDEFQVVTQYEVEGIPTKFVLDPKGQIAFKSVGYNANLEAMMSELDLMIDIARSNK